MRRAEPIAFQPLNGRITVERIPESVWNVDMNGNWSAAANWTPGVPNGIGVKAVFGSDHHPGAVCVDRYQ